MPLSGEFNIRTDEVERMALLCAMALMSAAAFVAMGLDKLRARRGDRRIPERTLLLLAVLLGAPGAYAGMMVFRHKTRHMRFAIGLPVLSAVELILVGWLVFSGRPSWV